MSKPNTLFRAWKKGYKLISKNAPTMLKYDHDMTYRALMLLNGKTTIELLNCIAEQNAISKAEVGTE